LEENEYSTDELEDLLAADNEVPTVTLVARPGLMNVDELADEAEDILDTRVALGVVSPRAVLLESGDPARVQTAITMAQVAEPYLTLRAIRHLEKGRVVVFGAGAGLPYFSTDTVSAQRALEIHCDELLVAKNGVDGVYDDDPNKNPDARRFDTLTYSEALRRDLKVIDGSALALCRENGLTTRIFGMGGDGAVTRALMGDEIGTLVTA